MNECPYFEHQSFPDGDVAYTGNPAGVCMPEDFLEDAVMQGIASSNKHAETAFLVKDPTVKDLWSLRWFTPAVEVDLCGHATLAAAATLFDREAVSAGTVFLLQREDV
ncbi:PhzF family phenazine biosynthesis protein [Hyphococcus sp.]|uniref:PhzF family phenazine biosynthesis protein n=1 Tax=Hyphococcus sp. TaxID=2038636 RepID=UPI003CCC440D